MPTMSEYDVAIVGGGLAGLKAARRLAEADTEVIVYESAPSVGGRVRTRKESGFTLDRGFQVLFTAYPEARRTLDLAALDLKRFPAGAVICRRNHRSIVADPIRDPAKAVEAAFSRDLTLGDKLRALSLKRRLRNRSREAIYTSPDSTIEAFLREYGFSKRFRDSFAAPFYGGITLDRSLGTSKRVFEFTYRMLSQGAAAVPAEGMEAIPAQIADRAREAGARIETEEPVESLSGTGPIDLELEAETVTADNVIVAAGPESSAALTGIESIPTEGRGSLTQYFSLPDGNPIGDQSRILLNTGGSVPNQVAVLSAVAPSYAPSDQILLSASTPGHLDEEDETLARQTRVALGSWYPEASFEDLELLETVRIPFAQYEQPPGIHEELPDETDPAGSVYLAGDITTDASINGALLSGRRGATAVLQG